jgi:hypothetical protein
MYFTAKIYHFTFPSLASGAGIFRRVLRFTPRSGRPAEASASTRRKSLHTEQKYYELAEKFLMRLPARAGKVVKD